MSTLENPFHPPLKGSGETDTEKDVKLVQKLLGDEDAALLASVRGKQGQRAETMPDDILTEEEREALVKAEHTEREAREQRENIWDRERYVEWADSVGRDEQWVDETFVFNTDGTVETRGSLEVRNIKSLSSFPPNITTVRGYLSLPDLTTGDNLTFPQTVHGSLSLFSLTTAEHTVWPKRIGRDLWIPRAFSAQAEQLKVSGVLKGDIKCDD